MNERRGTADGGMAVRRRGDKTYRKELEQLAREYNSNGKRTLLLACDAFFPVTDGVIHVLDNYARELMREMNVLVLVPATHGKVYLRDYPVLGVCGVFSATLNYQIALPAFDGRAKRLLKKFRIDLIHCHSPFFIGRYVLKLHRKHKIPMITTFHSQYRRDFVKYVGEGARTRFLMRFIMKTFNGSDEVWTMHAGAASVLESYGYRGKIRLLPNGVAPFPACNREEERRAARGKYGLGEVPVFLFAGRLVEQKNILFLAETLGELKRRGLRFRMIFAGDGPDRGKLEEKLRAEGVAQQTTLTGNLGREALSAVYSAADLFLFPSMYDVSSIVQMEAAAHFLPTVFLEGSLTSCTVQNGVNGFILPADPVAFADGICAILRDPPRLAGVAARAHRDLCPSWKEIAQRAEKYYGEIFSAREEGGDPPGDPIFCGRFVARP